MEGMQREQAMEQKRQAAEQRRTMILNQILEPSARERLDRIGIVRPEDKRRIEDQLVQQAQMGAIGGRVDEAQVKNMLASFVEQRSKSKVTIQRKRAFDDESEEEYDL